MSVDSLTVLCARSGLLAKQLAVRDGGWQVRGYSAGKWFGVEGMPVQDLATLGGTLERLTHDPRRCVIRVVPVPGINLERCRRLSNRAEHGDAVTFASSAAWWLAVDVDDLSEPAGLHFASEPEAADEHVWISCPSRSVRQAAGGRSRPAPPASSRVCAAACGSGARARWQTRKPRAGWPWRRSTARSIRRCSRIT